MSMAEKENKEKINQSLIKLAEGFEYEEKEIIADKSGRTTKMKIVKKYYPPDLSAIKLIQARIDNGKW